MYGVTVALVPRDLWGVCDVARVGSCRRAQVGQGMAGGMDGEMLQGLAALLAALSAAGGGRGPFGQPDDEGNEGFGSNVM